MHVSLGLHGRYNRKADLLTHFIRCLSYFFRALILVFRSPEPAKLVNWTNVSSHLEICTQMDLSSEVDWCTNETLLLIFLDLFYSLVVLFQAQTLFSTTNSRFSGVRNREYDDHQGASFVMIHLTSVASKCSQSVNGIHIDMMNLINLYLEIS